MIWAQVKNEQIYEWKKEWWAVFSITIADIDFVYRQLSQKEFQTIISTYTTDIEKEEAICAVCTLHPKDFPFSSTSAGIPTTLADAILYSSGMIDTEVVTEALSKYREEMKTLDNQLACVIVEAFPALKIDEVENWPLNKSIWYLSRAEYILNQLRQELRHGPFSYGEYAPEEAVTVHPTSIPAPSKPQASPKPQVPPLPIEKHNDILNDPAFDRDLLCPELAAQKKTELKGSRSDFPELSEIDAFMRGKWKGDE